MTATLILPQTRRVSMPIACASADLLPDNHLTPDAQNSNVVGSSSQPTNDHAELKSAALAESSSPTDRTFGDTQREFVGGGPLLRDSTLALLADTLVDFQAQRLAADNRVRQMTTGRKDPKRLTKGETPKNPHPDALGMDMREPNVYAMMTLATNAKKLEDEARKSLARAFRQTPFREYQRTHVGIGEPSLGKLLGIIGDPYWNDLYDRPRTVSELWSYCGYRVTNGYVSKKARGQQVNWSPKARTVMFNMVESCLRSRRGEYNELYYVARDKYADAVHPYSCVRCGPKGKPALEGSPLSAGHQNARAIRFVAKRILKDIWVVARDYHMGVQS